MQLTNQQILAVSDAIKHLDGQHVTQVVEGKAEKIFRGYRLAHAGRWLLAQAQGCLHRAIADYNRAKDALIMQHSDGTGSLSVQHPAFKAFSADLGALDKISVDLPLAPITLDHLKLEENEKAGNEVPISVLAGLSPLIQS